MHPDRTGTAAAPSQVSRGSTKSRLQALDLAKGIAILAVVHTHTVFWSGMAYLPDWTRRLALVFDVPVFFFVSGFLLAGQDPSKLWGRALRQIRSILVPYLGIGIAALLVSSLAKLVAHGGAGAQGLWRSLWTFLILSPTDSGWDMWTVFPGSLWFVRTYLLAMPIAVAILWGRLRRYIGWCFALCLAGMAFGGTSWIPRGGPIRTDGVAIVLSALTLMLAGAAFRSRWWDSWTLRKSGLFLLGWSLALGVVLVANPLEAVTDLPRAKFPPTWTYLLVNLLLIQWAIAMATFEASRKEAEVSSGWKEFLAWCGRHSFDLFLVQGLVTSLPDRFVGTLLGKGMGPLPVWGVTSAWNLLATLVGAWCLVRIRGRLASPRGG